MGNQLLFVTTSQTDQCRSRSAWRLLRSGCTSKKLATISGAATLRDVMVHIFDVRIPCACALLVLLEVQVLCIDSREPTSTELADNLAASDEPQHGCALGRTEPAFFVLCFAVSRIML